MNHVYQKTRIASAVLVVSQLLMVTVPLSAEVDLAGQWAPRFHEDWQERLPGPYVSDYSGMPINTAARVKGDAWEESVITEPERQCIPHPFPYNLHGPANLRIWSEVDPIGGRPVAWKVWGTFGRATHTMWMDGRPHPSKYAMHTWEGFTTGHWEGDTLVTFTDHVKVGYLRRNGIPTSDQVTVTEHWMRHGDTLTVNVIVYDPVYLTEPYIRTTDFQFDPAQPNALPQPCEPVIEILRPPGVVPHYLPGTNPTLDELTKMTNIMPEAARGGAETMYPEYRKKLKDKYVAPAKCERFCCGWIAALPNGIPPGLNCNQYGFVPPAASKQ
jgi:hypothetical protein